MTGRGIFLLICAGMVAAATVLATLLVLAECHYIYFNRRNLPDRGLFTRFEFSTIGHVYDAGGTPIIEPARELARYEDIPSVVRDAIMAAEDKRFFNRSLGSREIVGTAPAFPARMEERITASLVPPRPAPATNVNGDAVAGVFGPRPRRPLPGETDWLLTNAMIVVMPRER